MILNDFYQIVAATIFAESESNNCAKNPSIESKKLIKHFIINSIRANFVSQKEHYGQMVIACDSSSWRYDVFPQYKHQRKLKRQSDTSGINWSFVNEVRDELIEDMDKYFPFIVMKVPSCEGDDIIGVLTKYISSLEPVRDESNIFGDSEVEKVLIQSSDRDNFQLHKFKNVRQWSSLEKKLIKPATSARQVLIEKIVKGDSGDSDTFVQGIRQKPIAQKYLDTFYDSNNPIDMCLTEEEKINYKRNELLVSYEHIPVNIQESIISCYNDQIGKKHSKMGLYNYFNNNQMSNLLGQIHDFYI